MTTVLPLRVQAHCSTALPISAGDFRGDMGMGCIGSPAMLDEVVERKRLCGIRFEVYVADGYRRLARWESDSPHALSRTSGSSARGHARYDDTLRPDVGVIISGRVADRIVCMTALDETVLPVAIRASIPGG